MSTVRSPFRTLALCALGGSLLACGSPNAVRPTALIDGLVAVNGARMHIRCIGHGPQTVVFIPGFNDSGTNWDAIEGTISEAARVCSYARYGTGSSDPPPASQTFATQAHDLQALLQTANEPGPFVLVGHSFGGPEAVAFAAAYTDDVTGLLLIDASPVSWPAAVCEVREDGTKAAAALIENCASQIDPSKNDERLDALKAFSEVAQITNLGTMPMTVMTAAEHPFDGLNPTIAQRLNDTWNDGQRDWATLSTRATLVTVPDTGHYIQLDQPSTVIEQLELLLPPPAAP
jgi:pimeloyl-ACP methyl ester carboxylesterase